jgi:hypothetical protein
VRDNDSYIYRRGTTPNTRVVVSQKNKIFSVAHDNAAFSQVGVMSSFSVSESRGVEPVRGIGYGDQIAELVPGVTDPIGLSIERQLLYLANAHQVFGYAGGVDGLVRSLKHHQWPFDIKHELVFSRIATNASVPKQVSPATDGANEALLTFFEACWLNDYSYDFAADGAMVAESVSATVSDIVDGTSTYGQLASDAESTGNNPFSDVTGGSFRYGSGTGVPTF